MLLSSHREEEKEMCMPFCDLGLLGTACFCIGFFGSYKNYSGVSLIRGDNLPSGVWTPSFGLCRYQTANATTNPSIAPMFPFLSLEVIPGFQYMVKTLRVSWFAVNSPTGLAFKQIMLNPSGPYGFNISMCMPVPFEKKSQVPSFDIFNVKFPLLPWAASTVPAFEDVFSFFVL